MAASHLANVLRPQIGGTVIDASSPEYDDARRVWNGSIERHPAVVVRAQGQADVIATVRAAADAGLPLAVRCGGHSMPGLSTCDDGIVLDLREMRGVRVDPIARTAQVAGGALLGEVDRETLAHNLAVTTGTVSHTGIGGYTLGGGLGRLHRKLGLTIDNLLSVDMVTADGSFVRASETENPDLFWAVRGAGANYGVVTRFEFALHPMDTTVYGALAVHPLEQGADVLRFFREYGPSAPDEQLTIAVALMIPAGPPFPPEIHGMRGILLAAAYCANDEAGATASTEPMRTFGNPSFQGILPMPYAVFQTMADEQYKWGRRYYVKGAYVDDLTDAAIDTVLGRVADAPGGECEIDLFTLGGAMGRVPEDATAFTGRNAPFFVGVESSWDDPADDDSRVEWSRGSMAALEPHIGDGNYVNALLDEPEDVVRAAYGAAKYDRLVDLKTKWDPDNMFRFNQNIRPRP